MISKKIFLAATIPLVIAVAAGSAIIICHNSFGNETYCLSLVANEKNEMQNSIDELVSKRKQLLSDNDKYDILINENGLKTSEIDSLIEEYDSYTLKLDELKENETSLDDQIITKKSYIEQLDQISVPVTGEKKTFSAGEYKCPSQIPAGRYMIEGSGYFYIYSIANTASLKENLSTIDTHSFVFDIAEGESIKLTEECSISSVENVTSRENNGN